MHFDKVLQEIGDKGPYQISMLILMCISGTTTTVFILFSPIFISATPNHWCKLPPFNHTGDSSILTNNGHFNKCHMYNISYELYYDKIDDSEKLTWPIIPCQYGWNYDTNAFGETLVTKFNIVCEKSWKALLSINMFYIGSLIGTGVFGWISDKWGRRTAFLLSLFLDIFFTISVSFSPSFEVYSVLRFFCGLSYPALYQVCFILALELMGPQHRTMIGMIFCIWFSLSIAFLAILGSFIRDWQLLSLITSVPFIVLFSYYWIIPESPRWLLSQNRIEEAEKIVQRIAKTNNKKIPPNFLVKLKKENVPFDTSSKENISDHEEELIKSVPIIKVIKYPQLLIKCIIICFDWVAIAVAYIGLSYNVSNFGIEGHLALFISSIVDVPSHIIVWYLMDHWGRKPVLTTMMLLGGFSCVLTFMISEGSPWITFLLTVIGIFGSSSSFGVFYIYVGELLPTVIRSQVMAIASLMSSTGLLAFPYIIQLGEYNKVYPLVILGSMSLFGGILSTCLPDTLNVLLPQTLKDGDDLKLENPFGNLFRCNKKTGDHNNIKLEGDKI